MQWVAGRACRLRRKSCISICVHNAERLSRLMKVEHARAIAITRKGCVKRAHRRNPARTKLSSWFAESDFETRKHRTTVSLAMGQRRKLVPRIESLRILLDTVPCTDGVGN